MEMHTNYCLFCIFDTNLAFAVGSLQLLEGSKLLWELHVDHQLFSLAKLDMTVSLVIQAIECAPAHSP